MIAGIGTDIIEVDRIRESVRRFGSRFVDRVFCSREQAYFDTKTDAAPHMAGRFAAKEALAKALGTGIAGGLGWKQIQILNHDSGRPQISLSGKARDLLNQWKNPRIHVSISHTSNTATALVVLESCKE